MLMTDSILYVTYPLSALLIMSFAIGLGIFIIRKYGLGWRPYWVGGAVFIASQVFHIPFNRWLLQPMIQDSILPALVEGWHLSATAIMIGLSAGLFEETARYCAYRWWLKDDRSWAKGLLFGAGHGGVEALLVAGLVLLTYIQMVAIRGQDLASLVPPKQLELAQIQVSAFWSATWYDSLLSFVERALTIPVQISLSVLVLQVFLRGGYRWYWFAVGWHTLLDAVAVYSAQSFGIYMAEGLLAIFTAVSIALILALRDGKPPREREEIESTGPDTEIELTEVEETHENLEQTRYF
jgi:uncharacterized membrane protein YhfC